LPPPIAAQIEEHSEMQKLIFAAAIAVAATPLQAAQTADPDVSKLPAGPEKAIVAEVCTACHELGRIVNGSYDAAGWHNVVSMMVNAGAALTPDQIEPVTNYLIKGIPEKPFPPFKEVAGPVKVSIKEWVLPTPGSRPHDPLAAADGTVWYTGHMGSLIGHLDPKTGQIKEFHTKTPISGPHGLTMDRDGNVWYTGNFKGYIGKLDTKTGQFTEYKVGTARDPHTPLFDKNGILWFTAQNSNMLGRLDPKTGAFKLAVVPTERAAPYGMVFDSKGQLWFSEWQAPKLATVVNPETMELKEITLPNPGTRPRRIAIDGQDRIWISDYSRGYLGLYDTKTGATKEWASPGGPKSEPYGITTLNGVVWYVEGNTKPNALVRFDPNTEKFQTFAIPSGGGVVRNMMATKDGKGLVMAESGVNRVAVVTIN
jgi:virginiamycin B lyase